MNRLKLIAIFLMLLAQMPTRAQRAALTAAKCFSEAPADVMPLLSRNTRLDMLDYFKAGSDKSSANQFEGSCRILSIDSVAASSMVKYQEGEGIQCQLFVLNADTPEPIIGIIETLESPLSDSNVRLYNKSWEPIASLLMSPDDTLILPAPKLADWVVRSADVAATADKLPFIIASYTFDPAKLQLIATHQMDKYYVGDEGAEVLSKLKPQLVYAWNGKAFNLKKK